jgi:pyridoxamine-phosphate oxidase
MTLSTVKENGRPAARIVLLKGSEKDAYTFFTNYLSDKGKEIERNPFVSLTFFWSALQREVRIEGKAEKISEKASDEYFQSRPRGSQAGAIVSPQSQRIKDRKQLESAFAEFEADIQAGKNFDRPAHWGGYMVKPDRFEFWQGRQNRLHDRFLYELTAENRWSVCRLAP